MNGEAVKKILKSKGVKLNSLAILLEETPQNMSSLLNVADIKTGLLERISAATGIPISEFFGEKASISATMHGGNGNKMINGTGNTMTEGMPADVVALKREIELLQKMVDDKDAELKRKVDETNKLLEIIQKLTTMKSQI